MNEKLVIVTSIPLDEPVILNRILPLIDESVQRGYEVTLIGAEYSDTEVSSKLKRSELKLGLYKSRHKSKHSNLIIRLLRDIYIAFMIGKKLRGTDYESHLVLVTVPSMFLPIFTNRKAKAAKLCLDVRDLTWEYLIKSSTFGKILGLVVRQLMKRAARKFDYVSVTNGSEKLYISEQFNHSSVYTVANGVSISQYNQLAALKSKVKISNDTCVISYVGNIGIAQSFRSLLDIAAMMPSAQINIVGSGARLESVRNQVQERQLENVFLPGRVSWQSVISNYEQADILFLSLDEGYESAIPSKLYEYLTVGKPVIFVGSTHSKDQFHEFKGLYFCSDSSENLHDAIAMIQQSASISTEDIEWNRKLIKDNYIRERNWAVYLDEVSKGK